MHPYFLLVPLTLLLLPAPGFAQSERHPTDAEIVELLHEMQQAIPQLMETGIYSDRRSPEERQQRDTFAEAWSEVDATISPFLGDWVAIEENVAIFPTLTPGEVCIIDSYLDISDFYLGRVIDGNLSTDINLTFVLNSDFLVSTFVYDDQPGHYEYANPRPVQDPATSSYYSEYHPNIVEQFQQAGCWVEIPETK
ncbi:hypothetical protein [Halomicronema sp. CCY15110]|uniref:hypothetical protein n=1 Tax=Halomicronema sp. CCY15110 TaxID=2767773 RepID=UPI0019504099|nr:hypothetical protein [Halomicronema sp. CCY15110]